METFANFKNRQDILIQVNGAITLPRRIDNNTGPEHYYSTLSNFVADPNNHDVRWDPSVLANAGAFVGYEEDLGHLQYDVFGASVTTVDPESLIDFGDIPPTAYDENVHDVTDNVTFMFEDYRYVVELRIVRHYMIKGDATNVDTRSWIVRLFDDCGNPVPQLEFADDDGESDEREETEEFIRSVLMA